MTVRAGSSWWRGTEATASDYAPMRRLLLTLPVLLLLLVGAGLGRAEAEDAAGADTFIDDLGRQAIEALTDQNVPEDQREQRFRALLNANFDVPFIGRFALGRYWRTASPEQQSAYLDVFEDSLVRAYARRFLEYTGEQFAVQRAMPDEDGAVVMSTLTSSNGEQARIDWRLRSADGGGFRIIDVVVEGVSMAQTQREEYVAFVDANGGNIDALIQTLRDRAGSS